MMLSLRLKHRKTKYTLSNKGVSLIEVIVVILILAILSTAGIISVGYIHRVNASSCAAKLNSALEQTRNKTMSKQEGRISLVIYTKDKNYYAAICTDNAGTSEYDEGTLLGSTSLSLNVKTSDGTVTKLSDSEGMEYRINFVKGSGAFSSDIDEISVKGTKEVIIKLIKETGRSYIMKQE